MKKLKEKNKNNPLIFGVPTLCLNGGPISPRHTQNQVLKNLQRNFPPFPLNGPPQITFFFEHLLPLPHLRVQVLPEVLNWVQIWTVRGPVQNVEPMRFHPPCGVLRGVNGGQILLEC